MSWNKVTEFLFGRRPSPGSSRDETAPLIRKGIATGPSRRLPMFRGTASDSDRGIRGTATDAARLRLQRAFTPAQPVTDVRMFAGRNDTLLSLIRAVEEQQLHVVLFGDRGIGKTSLLHVFSQLARQARYIVRYVSCSESSEFDATFRAIASNIPLLYHADFDPTSDAAERGAVLSELLPASELGVAQVTEALAKLSGTRVLIVLDEFDRARSADFKRSVAELIKSLSDQAVRAQIVIAGVAANLTELVEHIPSIRRNVLGIPVEAMSDAEIGEIVSLGESVSGLRFGPDALRQIVEAAQGSPYVAGLIAQLAGSAAIDRNATDVASRDVADALRRTLVDIKVRLPLAGQQTLAHIGDEGLLNGTAPLAREALRRFGVIAATSEAIQREPDIVAKLLSLGALRRIRLGDEDAYQFSDDSVALYLWLEHRLQRDHTPTV